MRGIDVSSYQGNIDWNKVKNAGIGFAILRGTLKAGTIDTAFEKNYSGCLAAGIPVLGVYHYSYALNEETAAADARNMIRHLNGKKLPIWLDLEWDNQGMLGKDKVTTIAKAYINACRSLGYACQVYSNFDWYKNKYHAAELRAIGCKFWVARYPDSDNGTIRGALKPGCGECIWQYSSKGTVSGIAGAVDMNECYQTVQDILDNPGTPAGPAENPYPEPTGTVKLGSRGDHTKWVQYQLNQHGAILKVDGIFGPGTEAAVLEFQRRNALADDGIVGPKTKAVLKK